MPRRHSTVIAALVFLFLAGVVTAQEVRVEPRGEQGSRIEIVAAHGASTLRETAATVEAPRVILVPGRPAVGVTWEEIRDGARTSWFAVSRDGRDFGPARLADYELKLRLGAFDPLAGGTAVPSALNATGAGRLFVVQYETQGLEDYRRALAVLGARPRLFLPSYANVVEMDPDLIDRVRSLPFVRWVGPYHPAYRIDEALIPGLLDPVDASPRRYNILSLERGRSGQEPVVDFIRARGGRIEEWGGPTYLLSATLTPSQVIDLLHRDDVQWIDAWSPPEDDMDLARTFHGADFLETTVNYTGQGVRVEVMDGGCDVNHPDLQNFVLHTTNTPSAHGTCTSGIVVGSGAGSTAARGVMPDAFLSIADYSYYSNRYVHTAELQDPALPYRSVLQSNSWGNARTTAYTSISQDMDVILFDHDRISILQSQSNAGNQDSRPQAWAKNIISVGGIRHFNTLSEADDAWAGGASIGPAADGRIKPDIASFYDATFCTDQVGTAGYASGNYYSSFGGTSGATPIVAGHLGLLYQMWSNGDFGNPAPGSTVFENRPYNTTMKALLVNTARQWGFSGTNADLTRMHQGWGRPDLQTAWDRRSEMYIVDESDVLPNLGSTIHSLTVDVGTPELRATLVFRDNAGTTSSTLHRINDIDLKVTSPSGTVYWGNNGLTASVWSSAGGGPNSVDTVENVFVQNPQSGTWSVEVIAAELNQDTHVETGSLDADYALVVSGVLATIPAAPVASFTGSPVSGDAPLNVAFSDTSTGSISSWSWSFGDGATSTAQNPSHTYGAVGSYDVSLTVTGPGGSDTETLISFVSVSAPQPPAAPTGLSATATSDSTIDLAWTPGSTNETGFSIERADGGVANWAPLATVGAGVTSYTDAGLAAQTTYDYRVGAFNAVGSSGPSNVAFATTTAVGSTDFRTSSDIPGAGTVTGSHVSTQADDGIAQQLRERLSGGKPVNRYSYAEHTWTVPVQPSGAFDLVMNAWHGVSSDGDDFLIEWSSDNVVFTTAFVVTATADGTTLSASLPASLSGTVYVRASDTDQTAGNQALDTLFVDDLFIRGTGSAGSMPPLPPAGLNAAATSPTTIDLVWSDQSGTEDGFRIERSLDGVNFSLLVNTGADVESWSDSGLTGSTTYSYRVRAFNAAGPSAWSNVATATTPAAGAVDDVASGETAIDGSVDGTYLDTVTANGVVETITEERTGGPPSQRVTFLEHLWQLNVTGGSSVEFRLRAWRSTSSDNDDFVFAWSSDGINFTDMVTVTATSDPGTYQTFPLPPTLSGTVWVRVRDTDRTAGSNDRDQINVDHLLIRSQ